MLQHQTRQSTYIFISVQSGWGKMILASLGSAAPMAPIILYITYIYDNIFSKSPLGPLLQTRKDLAKYIVHILEAVQGSKTWYLFHSAPTKDALRYPFQKIFWFSSKFDHKLLGTYISLVQAVLSLATCRTRSCQRSLLLTLLKFFSKM